MAYYFTSLSGYCDCACRDCFDVAITSTNKLALCHACRDAGCDGESASECARDDAYGCAEEVEP